MSLQARSRKSYTICSNANEETATLIGPPFPLDRKSVGAPNALSSSSVFMAKFESARQPPSSTCWESPEQSLLAAFVSCLTSSQRVRRPFTSTQAPLWTARAAYAPVPPQPASPNRLRDSRSPTTDGSRSLRNRVSRRSCIVITRSRCSKFELYRNKLGS